MRGYALFRGATLVGHVLDVNEDPSALHDIGQEGDVLVYLGTKHIATYLWNTPVNAEDNWWIPFSDPDSKRYRVLALIQS